MAAVIRSSRARSAEGSTKPAIPHMTFRPPSRAQDVLERALAAGEAAVEAAAPQLEHRGQARRPRLVEQGESAAQRGCTAGAGVVSAVEGGGGGGGGRRSPSGAIRVNARTTNPGPASLCA